MALAAASKFNTERDIPILDPDVVAGDGDAWRTAYAAEMRIYTAVNKLLLRYLGYTGPVVDWGENPLDSPEWTFVPL